MRPVGFASTTPATRSTGTRATLAYATTAANAMLRSRYIVAPVCCSGRSPGTAREAAYPCERPTSCGMHPDSIARATQTRVVQLRSLQYGVVIL